MSKFYITTAIAYPNAAPHIGFAMEMLQADVLARYHRLRGDETYFLTGTDEHGSKNYKAAQEAGEAPEDFVKKNSDKFEELGKLLNVSNDDFIRTTSDRHKSAASKLWKMMADKGDIYKAKYTGLYCVGCEAFITEKDLVDGKCADHLAEPEKLEEENYFFRLSAYNEQLGRLIENDALRVVPASRKNEILQVIKGGLQDVSFSRPRKALPWGIPVPGDPDHIMYVWCDALSNYITALGFEHEDETYKKFWPADVHLVGKGILRFHAGIWPGMLLSAGVPLPRAVYVHGYITVEGQKMSKSLGNVIDPVETAKTRGVDPTRYYLLRAVPTGTDGDFSSERFAALYESELANDIGNLLSRVLAMVAKSSDGKTPAVSENADLRAKVAAAWEAYDKHIRDFDLKAAAEEVLKLVSFCNQYINDTRPWEMTDENARGKILYELLELLRHITLMLSPYIPASAGKMAAQLGIELTGDFEKLSSWGTLKEGTVTRKGDPLFPRQQA